MNRANPLGQAEPKIKSAARPFLKWAWAGPKAGLGPQAFWRSLHLTLKNDFKKLCFMKFLKKFHSLSGKE